MTNFTWSFAFRHMHPCTYTSHMCLTLVPCWQIQKLDLSFLLKNSWIISLYCICVAHRAKSNFHFLSLELHLHMHWTLKILFTCTERIRLSSNQFSYHFNKPQILPKNIANFMIYYLNKLESKFTFKDKIRDSILIIMISTLRVRGEHW